jgi:twitching motility protein PilT
LFNLEDWKQLCQEFLSESQMIGLETTGVVHTQKVTQVGMSLEMTFNTTESHHLLYVKVRRKELVRIQMSDIFYQVFRNQPGIYVVSGLLSTGKTSFIASLIEQQSETVHWNVAWVSKNRMDAPLAVKSKMSVVYYKPVEIEILRSTSSCYHLIIFDLNTYDHFDLALDLAEAGHRVICTVNAPQVDTVVQNLISKSGEKTSQRKRMSEALKYIVNYEFVDKGPDSYSIQETLGFSSDVKKNFTMGESQIIKLIPSESGYYTSRNQSLMQHLVRRRIDLKKAFEMSYDPEDLDLLLKKVGV